MKELKLTSANVHIFSNYVSTANVNNACSQTDIATLYKGRSATGRCQEAAKSPFKHPQTQCVRFCEPGFFSHHQCLSPFGNMMSLMCDAGQGTLLGSSRKSIQGPPTARFLGRFGLGSGSFGHHQCLSPLLMTSSNHQGYGPPVMS